MYQGSEIEVDARSKFGRFYTSCAISDLLINEMDAHHPSSILDLGAGAGSLSHAARRRWQYAPIVTVDLNSKRVLENRETLGGDAALHSHFKGDALGVRLPKLIKKLYGAFGATISNPPYTPSLWKDKYQGILDEAGLSISINENVSFGTEMLFLAQALRMTAAGGDIGIIVPDGIVTGERHKKLRQKIMENNDLERVISLPRRIFRHTEALTHILFIKKGAQSNGLIRLQQASAGGHLSDPLFVDRQCGIDRLDYSFHVDRQSAPPVASFSLGDLGASVARGQLSSVERQQAPFPVFHTSNFSTNQAIFSVPTSLRAPAKLPNGVTSALPGDILIARVDRKLENKVCLVASGEMIISDCILRLRLPAAYVRRTFDALTSPRGRSWLSSAARGVGAKYLTASTLLDFRL